MLGQDHGPEPLAIQGARSGGPRCDETHGSQSLESVLGTGIGNPEDFAHFTSGGATVLLDERQHRGIAHDQFPLLEGLPGDRFERGGQCLESLVAAQEPFPSSALNEEGRESADAPFEALLPVGFEGGSR